MAQKPAADWVNFEEIKAKVGFEEVLGHFGIWSGIDREEGNLVGPCRICGAEGPRAGRQKTGRPPVVTPRTPEASSDSPPS